MSYAAANELFLPPDQKRAADGNVNGQQISRGGYEEDTASTSENVRSWRLESASLPHSNGHLRVPSPITIINTSVPLSELAPGQRRSQSGVASTSFLLGTTVGSSFFLALHAARWLDTPQPFKIWRVWFLLAFLALWHFLEFWTHARYNVPKAYISTFLLFNNGWQHTAANALALSEAFVTSTLCPGWQSFFSRPLLQYIGLAMLVVGQTCRSTAMAQAGTSFNHVVQTRRSPDHRLVTTGIYRYLRHPSYFGFFWWAVGMQMVLGNAFCFTFYIWVLWRFFQRRIAHEEKHLITFFGDDYKTYRATTWVGIPFIH